MIPPVFVELACGSAAVSLALVAGVDARPPAPYQGSKRGYVDAVLGAFGLSPGAGARAIWLNDPGPWSLAWRDLVRPAGLRAVLDELAAMAGADVDDEALWRSLRAKRGVGLTAAEWLVLQSWNYAGKPAEPGKMSLNRDRIGRPDRDGRMGVAKVAGRVEELSMVMWPTSTLVTSSPATALYPPAATGWSDPAPVPELGAFIAELEPGTPWCVYVDPPYQGTAGYGHAFARAEVLDVANRWADAGAAVVVSEAEPLDGALGAGWSAVEITGERRGGPRTFSRQQREWLTVSRAGAG